jgi:hypothetical protein
VNVTTFCPVKLEVIWKGKIRGRMSNRDVHPCPSLSSVISIVVLSPEEFGSSKTI